jgi:AraC-like DNA-binding protein
MKAMALFEAFLAARRYQPLHLKEICAAIGVPERTLRGYCYKYLGTGPTHYLWLKRMDLVHRELLSADAKGMTVTKIATAHSFYELGRFSVDYRVLFGESPSETLRR